MLNPEQMAAIEIQSKLILDSYARWLGKPLIEPIPEKSLSDSLFHSPVVVLSHGTQADPVLNYGNAAALRLWEMDWEMFTRNPSRLTAEPMERSVREQFLKQVTAHGYVDSYTGVRISSTGRRFYILQATVWNLIDDEERYCGQAAAFSSFRDV